MKKGAIPVPYIIAIILGLIVVGVLAYGFFVLNWQIPGVSKEWQCNYRKYRYCDSWSKCNFGGGCDPGLWTTYAPGCKEIGVSADIPTCKETIGYKKATGDRCSDDGQCLSADCDIPSGAAEGVCK